MSMKTRLFLFGAICIAVVNVHATPLKVVKVNASTFNCLFNSNCTVAVNNLVTPFVTNMPPYTVNPTNPPQTETNLALSGYLQSRTFKGQPGTPEAGLTAYEYRLVLQHLTKTTGIKGVSRKSFSINSLAFNFSPYSSFNYNKQASNQVWVVTSGGPGSVGLSSAVASGSKVTFNFNPPLTFLSASNQESSSYFFGMLSPHPSPNSVDGWATCTGSEQLSSGSPIPINFLMLLVRTP